MIGILLGLHLAAILFYRVVRKKRLIAPIIIGRGDIDPGTEPMRRGKWWAALLCLAAAFAVTRWVVAGAPPFGP